MLDRATVAGLRDEALISALTVAVQTEAQVIGWTAPTGHRYIKTHGAAMMFPGNIIQTPTPPVRAVASKTAASTGRP
jgi:hypothetical protein